MQEVAEPSDACPFRIGILHSEYYQSVADGLLAGALGELKRCGIESTKIVRVAGAFDIPCVAKAMASVNHYDGLIALGCVIRGETAHFEFISGQCAEGLMAISIEHALPIGFGVLTVDTIEQAIARSGKDDRNKGAEAAVAVVTSIQAIARICAD